jgi:dihydropteroate synthase
MLTLEMLSDLVSRYPEALAATTRSFDIRGRSFNQPPHLMGVINLSRDSWYRESVCLTPEQAIRRGRKLSAEGADLIDIGAESTLLNAEIASEGQQNEQLLPVLEKLNAGGILTSIETYHPAVAEACLQKGAAVLNLTGPEANDEMFRLAARHRAGVVICYVAAGNVRTVTRLDVSDDHVQTLMTFFDRQITAATRAGVEAIWIDPGMGFYYQNLQDSAERVRYQMNTFLQTFRLRELGWPVCHALPHAVAYFGEEVRCSEPFFAVPAILGKTELLRTHEISRVRAVVDTLNVFRP